MQLNIPTKYFFSGIDFGEDCKDFITPLENVLNQFDTMYSSTLSFSEFHKNVINKFIRYRNVDTTRYFNSTQEGEKLDNSDIERYLAARNEENQTISDLNRDRPVSITLGDWAEQRLAQGADAVMNKVKHQIRERFGQDILNRVEETVKFGNGTDILSGLNIINEGYKDTLAGISMTIAQIQKTISALINVGEAFQQLYDVTTVQYLTPTSTNTNVPGGINPNLLRFRFIAPTQVIEGFQNFELDIVSDLNKIYRMVEKNISESVVESLRLNIAKYMYYRDYINRIQQFNFLQVGLPTKKDDLTFVKWKDMLQPPVTRTPVESETILKRYVDSGLPPPPTVPIRDFSDNSTDYIQNVKERMYQRPTNVSEAHQQKAHAKRRVRRMRRGLVTGQSDISSEDLAENEVANILGLDLASAKF